MFSSLHLLDDVEPRVQGLPFEPALEALSPQRIEIALGGASVAESMWALPVIDALAACFPEAALRVRGQAMAAALVVAHLPARVERGTKARLQVDLAPNRRRRGRWEGSHRLIVPTAPFPARDQHASAHRIDGARSVGLDADDGAPRLRLPLRTRATARSLARRLGGGAPLIALLPGASASWGAARLAEVGEGLAARVGAVAIPSPEQFDPALFAALLALCAVCVGDDGDWTHVAAAVGAPVVTVHGATSPVRSGPASPVGAALWTTAGTCARCRAAPSPRRCLPCLDATPVIEVAERLAAQRWPWDRLQRLVP